nr:magnetosome protein MamE-Nter-greigite [Desulfobacteraceae bacterium]
MRHTVNRMKDFVASYLTGLLSILLVLNLIIVFFSMLGISWQDFLQFSNTVIEMVNTSSRNLLHEPHQTTQDETIHVIKKASGAISDANIQLVCSDETFAMATSKVRTAVVSITCDQIESVKPSGNTDFEDPTPNLRILGGIGSGIIIDPRGFILTCYHIIAKASNINIIPFGYEEKRYKAYIFAFDEKLNLSILHIQEPIQQLKAATLGDSSLMEVADMVLAIGNPFGLEQSVTHGIVSDNKRNLFINGKLYRDMMQTDAAINKGSSGGALINMNGEVIGINMAIYSTTGVYNGVSFALPINQAKSFIAKTIPSG